MSNAQADLRDHDYRGEQIWPTTDAHAKGRWYVVREDRGMAVAEQDSAQFPTLESAREFIDFDLAERS